MSDFDTDHDTITRLNKRLAQVKLKLSVMQQRAEIAEALANNSSVENIVLKKRVFQLENRCETCTQVDGG